MQNNEEKGNDKALFDGLLRYCTGAMVYKLDENIFPTKTIFLSKDLFDAIKMDG